MIKNLMTTDPKLIVDCLHEAFSDYAVPMKMPSKYWIDRWEMANISYEYSYGYFDNHQLVGFLLHGLDHWNGNDCFYNMATGVIPTYRGQGIVTKIYEHCKALLSSNKINYGYLEVLTNNKKAIRAYEKAEFKIIDELISYQLSPLKNSNSDFHFSKVEEYNSEKYKHLKHHRLSFEHRDEIINRNPDAFSIFELRQANNCTAYAIVKVSNQNILQFGFLNNNMKRYGIPLFSKLGKEFPTSRIINISKKDLELVNFLNEINFQVFISQYSMQLHY